MSIDFNCALNYFCDKKLFNDKGCCRVNDARIINGKINFINVQSEQENDMKWIRFTNVSFENSVDLDEVFEKFFYIEKMEIDISRGLQRINKTLFIKSINLTSLNIRGTELITIGKYFLATLVRLKILIMTSCNIEFIHKYAFEELVAVEEIVLSKNVIKFLHHETFNGNQNLRKLLINYNQLFMLEASLLHKQTDLRELQLRNNSIMFIEKGFFAYLDMIELIDFSNNLCINAAITSPLAINTYKFHTCNGNFEAWKNLNAASLNYEQILNDSTNLKKIKNVSNINITEKQNPRQNQCIDVAYNKCVSNNETMSELPKVFLQSNDVQKIHQKVETEDNKYFWILLAISNALIITFFIIILAWALLRTKNFPIAESIPL